MNRVRIIAVGKTKEAWIENGLEKFRKRLRPYTKVEEKVLNPGKGSRDEVRQMEAKLISESLTPSDFVILLDEKGKDLSSVKMAEAIEQYGIQGTSTITFIIGGAYGVDKEIMERAKVTWRLSSMTFTHQMVRVILMEQLYRAFSIMRGEKYHH